MKTLILILLTLFSASAMAQDDAMFIQEGDRNFEREQYHLAIEYYLKLEKKNTQVYFRLAESYRNTFNYPEAEKSYLEVLNSGEKNAMASYYYSLMLKLNSKYALSITSFDVFLTEFSLHSDLDDFIEQATIERAGSEAAVKDISKDEQQYSLTGESFNSAYNDYAPAWLDTMRVMITSGRVQSAREVIDERYGEAFTDNYLFERNGQSWIDVTRKSIRNINSRFNDGSGSFNQKKDKYYFTVCGKESSECRIFMTQYADGRWTDPVALNENINYKKFEVKHPTVSPGGDTLLFASNRPGGSGQFDIWMSVDSDNEQWGPAINLGNSINTRFNDLAPSFSEFDHIFFFSSEGHQGFGGMDLYMAKRFSNGTSAVYNIGIPFNSNRDDCFVSLGSNEMFIGSNRDGGKGGFDIYSAPFTSPLSFVSRISLRNKSGRNDVTLLMAGRESTWMDIYASRNEDRIEYENLPNEKRKLVDRMVASRSTGQNIKRDEFSYLSAGEFEQLMSISQTQYTQLELRKKYHGKLLTSIKPPHDSHSFGLHAIIIDSTSGKAVEGITVMLMNERGEVLKATTTNGEGIFRFTNVESSERLYVRFEGHVNNDVTPVVKDVLVLREETGSFAFDNIYFDSDQFEIRQDGKETLKRLSEFLLKLPDVQVEIFAYADDRGRDEYNFALSEKRGDAVRNYLGKLGVDPTSVAVVAKGRQFDATNPNLEEHRQFNRRVEFYINGASKESVAAHGNKGAP